MDANYLRHVSEAELNGLKFRASGMTTRLIDEFVQKFFNEPMGTKIYVNDHYGFAQSANDRATVLLIDKLRGRIENEHHCKFHTGRDFNGFYIIRDEKTFHECVEEEIKRREENGKGNT